MEADLTVYLTLLLVVLYGQNTGANSNTLYGYDEPIVQLSAHNISQIYTGDSAWVVEFYATWCGHCQRFAPMWSQLAQDVKDWRSVIKLATIACSVPNNAAICSHYHIWGYPTVKFFPPNAGQNKGHQYKEDKSVDKLRGHMVQFLSQMGSRAPSSWPNLQQLSHLDTAWQTAPSNTRILFVIFEDLSDPGYDVFLSRELILDMSAHPGVSVVRMDKALAEQNGLTGALPVLYKLDLNGGLQLVARQQTRSGFRQAIESYMSLTTPGYSTTPPTIVSSISTTGPPLDISIPDGIHMQDLESALYYSLWVELASRDSITGLAFEALRDYVEVLAKYYPGHPKHMAFLSGLSQWLRQIQPSQGMDSNLWTTTINQLRLCSPPCTDTYSLRWVGCAGSSQSYRGYPCSLWMLFHTLTVSAYDTHHQGDHYDPKEVLLAMRGYISNFMGCRECAYHFMQFAVNIEQDVRVSDDGVLWLWRGHNGANRRLAGDLTEDPQHPKIQFPTQRACPDCRHYRLNSQGNWTVEWNEADVLAYLRRFYGKQYVIQDIQDFFGQGDHNNGGHTCRPIEEAWGPCSKTCGTGMSVRMSNQNSRCRMEMEMRLCQIRPCQAADECSANTLIASDATQLEIGGCRTEPLRKRRSCTTCGTWCCYPYRDNTRWVTVTCGADTNRRRYQSDRSRRREQTTGSVQIMEIDQCVCSHVCPTWYQ